MNGYEFYCRNCGCEKDTEQMIFDCPECGSGDVCNSSFITCECGTRVYLDRTVNICPHCEKMYNGFGEELAPTEEWDDDDFYGTFGPQNYYDY